MKDIFCYQGYHFFPVGCLPKEDDFFTITKRLVHDSEMKLSAYRWGPKGYSWQKFYEACGYLKIDLFYCTETKRLYLPGEKELFIYQPEEGTYFAQQLENLRATRL